MIFNRIKRHFVEEWREYTTAVICGGIIYFCGYMASRGIPDNSYLERKLEQRPSQLILNKRKSSSTIDIGVQREPLFFMSYESLISGKCPEELFKEVYFDKQRKKQ